MPDSGRICHDYQTVIELTDKGLFCEAGGFHIDPSRRVELALITHSHSDHARAGSRHYITAKSGVELLARRVGAEAKITGVEYRKPFQLGPVTVSFHPAGHILGSAQIRVEHEGEVWVASGDYKRDHDPSCEPFEPVKCDTFISEATFGNPKYKWDCALGVVEQIHEWWEANRKIGKNSILFAYALGKTQRVLAALKKHTDRPVYVFGEGHALSECYRNQGVEMVPFRRLEDLKRGEKLEGELIVAPHSLNQSPYMSRLKGAETAFASGWMKTGAWGMGRSYDRGFALSDHADWDGLVRTIRETEAKRVLILYTKDAALPKHLRKLGITAELMGRKEPRDLFGEKPRAPDSSGQLSLF